MTNEVQIVLVRSKAKIGCLKRTRSFQPHSSFPFLYSYDSVEFLEVKSEEEIKRRRCL